MFSGIGAIKRDVESVITHLESYGEQYKLAKNIKVKEALYYQIRKEYNDIRKVDTLKRYNPKITPKMVAMTIFLNRTCFNGLYRVNSKGGFNVPFGKQKNPRICDPDNLRSVAVLLQKAVLTNKDFKVIQGSVKPHSFVYFDPPYKPISPTASFTAYHSNCFDDGEQRRLARLFKKLHKISDVKLMLSNSSPESRFFEDLYCGPDYRFEKVSAARFINCVAEKRGKIDEILIMNYPA